MRDKTVVNESFIEKNELYYQTYTIAFTHNFLYFAESIDRSEPIITPEVTILTIHIYENIIHISG